MTHPTIACLARCALYARALAPTHTTITLGQITLLPHQASAVRWLQHRIARYGGALLADPPGLGKTYVALAIAHLRHTRPLIIAPAALRSRWLDAAAATDVPLDFISTERLSQPAPPPLASHDFVVIDEAHHLRSATTRRHQRTARLCREAHVLLLTATPIHNHPSDLEHIAALFHLPATRLTAAALRRLTLRRTLEQLHAAGMADGHTLAVPSVRHRGVIPAPPRNGDVTAAIMRIPPIGNADAEGHPLLQLGLLHALRSSDAACAARVRNRIAGTLAIEHATRAHITPTRAIRHAWIAGTHEIQLAMPELLGTRSDTVDPQHAETAAAQRRSLEALLPSLTGTGDTHRATALRRFARWCQHPVVAFTQFTATAESLYRQLRDTPGIALLCGAHARIASGVISRRDVIARLLSPDRRRHTAVRLLITTDVLSEGLSLAGVATIIHLDLPWTAARIDQRIGRAARIGAGTHDVQVVELPASTPADTMARLHTLLARKRKAMHQFDGERVRKSERARITLLAQLASQAASSTVTPDWLTVRSPEVTRQIALALVRMHGRRQLVVHDTADGLRAPTHHDWIAIARAETSVEGASRGERRRLRLALQHHVEELQLQQTVQRTANERLVARRTVDEQLFASSPARRLALATGVSAARRDTIKPSRRGHVDRTTASLEPFGTSTKPSGAERQLRTPSCERVSVKRGVVIMPLTTDPYPPPLCSVQ